MRKLCASILFVAACGGDNKQTPDAPVIVLPDASPDAPSIDAPPDAPNFDFSCAGMGQGTPTATVAISGIAGEGSMSGSITPVADATVTLFKRATPADVTLDTQGPTLADGVFAFAPQSTDNAPLDAYVEVAHAADRTSFVFPPKPFVADQAGIPGLMITNAQFSQLSSFLGQTAGNGSFIIVVNDCKSALVAGSTLSVKQNGADVGNIFDVGQIQPQAAGTFIVANVPPGVATVSATFGSTTLAAHDIEAFADADSVTQVVP